MCGKGLLTRNAMSAVTLALIICLHSSFAANIGMVDVAVPRFAVGTANADMVINAGETIELECSSNEADVISWSYPRQTIDLQAGIQTADIALTISKEGSVPNFSSKLTLTETTYRDTGIYQCTCGGMSDMSHVVKQHIGNKIISKRNVYVYVSDAGHLFQGETTTAREAVTSSARGAAILPCAVNNPNTTVELVRGGGYNRISVVQMDGKKYQYDSKLGVIISRLSIRDTGAYTCRATSGDFVETKDFYLHVTSRRPLLQIPILRGLESINLGMSTSLKCQVAAGKHQLTAISWWRKVGDQPAVQIEDSDRLSIEEPLLTEAMCSGNRTMCSFKRHMLAQTNVAEESMYIRLIGRLRINDAEPTDSGTYFCKAWSSGLTMTSNMLDFTVTGIMVSISGNNDVESLHRYNVVSKLEV